MVEDSLEAEVADGFVEFEGRQLPRPPAGMTYAHNPDASNDGNAYRLVTLMPGRSSSYWDSSKESSNEAIPPICGCDVRY